MRQVLDPRTPALTLGPPPEPAPPSHPLRDAWPSWSDALVGADPGLNRLRSASMGVLTIAAALGAEWLFVHLTGALQVAGSGAAAAKADHEYLVIAMLLGAVVGMISAVGVSDTDARGQLVTTLLLPVPMVAALTFGIEIGGHRLLSLVCLTGILTLGTYCRRFGPRGVIAGLLLFMGDFFGFFLHGAVGVGDVGWLTAELSVGLAVAIAVRFGLFFPDAHRALARTRRSYAARARTVASLALAAFDRPDDMARHVDRQLVRLNEAALMIDAQLGDPGTVGTAPGALLRQRLFDLELALTNLARFATALGRTELDGTDRELVRATLTALVGRDSERARVHAEVLVHRREAVAPTGAGPDDHSPVTEIVLRRFATTAVDLADAVTAWLSGTGDEQDPGLEPFTPAVGLFGGWLPGSSQVSAAASKEPGTGWRDRARVAPYTRAAVQVGVAVGLAIALGDALSGARFYWAVIAAFITFSGTNTSGEQARKAVGRVVGTVAGIAAGSGLVDLVGTHTNWSIAVILVSLFFGLYLQRVNYAFMVTGVTVVIAQLYVQLGEFSHAVLLLRLEETALGAAVAVLVVSVLLPLRTTRVARVALRHQTEALATLAADAGAQLLGRGDGVGALVADARAVDAAFQALAATVAPLRHSPGAPDLRALRPAAAARHYARNLVADVPASGTLDAATLDAVARGTAGLAEGIEVITDALSGGPGRTYVRSASILEGAGGGSGSMAVRDLMLVDGAMAALAGELGLAVSDLDTTRLDTARLDVSRRP